MYIIMLNMYYYTFILEKLYCYDNQAILDLGDSERSSRHQDVILYLCHNAVAGTFQHKVWDLYEGCVQVEPDSHLATLSCPMNTQLCFMEKVGDNKSKKLTWEDCLLKREPLRCCESHLVLKAETMRGSRQIWRNLDFEFPDLWVQRIHVGRTALLPVQSTHVPVCLLCSLLLPTPDPAFKPCSKVKFSPS